MQPVARPPRPHGPPRPPRRDEAIDECEGETTASVLLNEIIPAGAMLGQLVDAMHGELATMAKALHVLSKVIIRDCARAPALQPLQPPPGHGEAGPSQ
jgi:hypothetical protein